MAATLDVRADLSEYPWSDVPDAAVVPGVIERVALVLSDALDPVPLVVVLVRVPGGAVVVAETSVRLAAGATRLLARSRIALMEAQ